MGQSFAAFLYGLPGSGNFTINDSYADQSNVPALFIQDDWKLSRKFTLSLGLRYERPTPVTERYNRSVRGFDAAVASPIQAQALANYARSPIPELPVSQFKALGGLTFAGVNGQPRELWKSDQNLIMPRIGFAYSITPMTVLRGGYGIFFDALGVVNANVNQTGFTQSTDFVPSLDNGLTYAANLTNPFPGGFLAPPGASGGLSTSLGQGITFFDPNTTSSYMQRWQLALQRQLVANTLIEVSYVGNRGTRMQVTRDLNPTPAQYLSTSPVRDQATIDFSERAGGESVLPAAAQDEPGLHHRGAFPVAQTVPAIQRREFRAKRRLLLVSLAAGPDREALLRRSERLAVVHLVENHGGAFLSEPDRYEAGRSDFQPGSHPPARRHRDVRIAVRTRQAVPRSVECDRLEDNQRLAGAGHLHRRKAARPWDSATPFSWATCTTFRCPRISATWTAGSISMPASTATPRRQLASNIRTFSSRFSGVRADGPNNWDISFIKNTRISEGTQLQFRAEAINALNHPQFTAPNTHRHQHCFRHCHRRVCLAARDSVRTEAAVLIRPVRP